MSAPLSGATSRRWSEVAPGVYVTHSRLDRTASIVVTRAGSAGLDALVVDPAWTPSELAGLAADVHAAGLHVVAGFATHAHHDHVLWHPDLGGAPRWASPRAAELATAHAEENRAALRASSPGWNADLLALASVVEPLDGQALAGWGEVITHDGHSSGHSALWLPHVRVLIAGDMLSDAEIPLLAETGAGAYADGLAVLRPYAEAARVLIPGHGTPTPQGAVHWAADHRYLQDLLAGRTPDDPRLAHPVNQRHHADNVGALQ